MIHMWGKGAAPLRQAQRSGMARHARMMSSPPSRPPFPLPPPPPTAHDGAQEYRQGRYVGSGKMVSICV